MNGTSLKKIGVDDLLPLLTIDCQKMRVKLSSKTDQKIILNTSFTLDIFVVFFDTSLYDVSVCH